jgi:hypothetical protein
MQYPYSKLQHALLGALSDRIRKTTIELVDDVYVDPPIFARQSVLGALRHLAKKVEGNGEQFRVRSTNRHGNDPLEWWIETSSMERVGNPTAKNFVGRPDTNRPNYRETSGPFSIFGQKPNESFEADEERTSDALDE